MIDDLSGSKTRFLTIKNVIDELERRLTHQRQEDEDFL